MMNIYSAPMLISGVLCSVLAIVTLMFRRRENINRTFSMFALALAIDSFSFFAWFQFGTAEHVDTWIRFTFTVGFLVPTALILFFYAFTGYDKKLDAKVMGISARSFRNVTIPLMVAFMILAQFTQLLIRASEAPEHIWDTEFGPVGLVVYPLFTVIFVYLFTMAFKSYKTSGDGPQKRFILLLSMGTLIWLLIGYGGAVFATPAREIYWPITYFGITTMVVFYFVAIVNYQSDQVHELNLNLERKVDERTRHLRETQVQLVQSEKMAALGHLVAGVAHEMNTPVGAIYSTQGTLEAATAKLNQTLESEHGIVTHESAKLSRIMNAISSATEVIRISSERITEIVKKLKLFAQLDEADLQSVDFNECIENTATLFQNHLKPGITMRREFADLPAVTCYPAKINQLCFQMLRNANQAVEESGEITLRTELLGNEVHLSVADDGPGIAPEDIGKIFDPGFTGWQLNVGTGLGLAICYQVSQEHEGRIDVESEPGMGSKFTFSFPHS